MMTWREHLCDMDTLRKPKQGCCMVRVASMQNSEQELEGLWVSVNDHTRMTSWFHSEIPGPLVCGDRVELTQTRY